MKLRTQTVGELSSLLVQKHQEADAAPRAAKVERDRQPKDSEAWKQWDKEYKQHNKVASGIYKVKQRLKQRAEEPPFSHPFYWAASTCSGLRSHLALN